MHVLQSHDMLQVKMQSAPGKTNALQVATEVLRSTEGSHFEFRLCCPTTQSCRKILRMSIPNLPNPLCDNLDRFDLSRALSNAVGCTLFGKHSTTLKKIAGWQHHPRARVLWHCAMPWDHRICTSRTGCTRVPSQHTRHQDVQVASQCIGACRHSRMKALWACTEAWRLRCALLLSSMLFFSPAEALSTWR